jgi:hypothetical protein
MLCPAIDNPVSCGVRSVNRFLHSKKMNAAEVHRELCAVYGQNLMSERSIRQWCKMSKDGRTNVHDEERIGRPFICSE